MEKEIKILYDKEADFLEVIFEKKTGYFKETENDAVMEKVDDKGNIYVADTGNNVIRVVTAAGVSSTLAGIPGVRGSADGLGTIAQGNLEVSNVDVAEEMVNMIIGQRAYEANSKTILTVDNMLSLVNNLKR